MLTRALLVLMLLGGSLALPVTSSAEEPKLLALGLADHEVTEAELAEGKTLPTPKFNTPGIAYALVANVKKGDVVEITFNNDKGPLHRNSVTLDEDRANVLLQAGKRGVPAGGWPSEWTYLAAVKVTRDGKTLIEQSSEPVAFE